MNGTNPEPAATSGERPIALDVVAAARAAMAADIDWTDPDAARELVLDLRTAVRRLLWLVDGINLTPDQVVVAFGTGAMRALAAADQIDANRTEADR